MSTLPDRFATDEYAEDEPVAFMVCATGAEPDLAVAVNVPERLFRRAQSIATAYELHLLPAVDVYADTRLSGAQLSTFQDEVVFLRSVIRDPLLDDHLGRIQSLIDTRWRSPEGTELVISGP